jgi:hypothetical protein
MSKQDMQDIRILAENKIEKLASQLAEAIFMLDKAQARVDELEETILSFENIADIAKDLGGVLDDEEDEEDDDELMSPVRLAELERLILDCLSSNPSDAMSSSMLQFAINGKEGYKNVLKTFEVKTALCTLMSKGLIGWSNDSGDTEMFYRTGKSAANTEDIDVAVLSALSGRPGGHTR